LKRGRGVTLVGEGFCTLPADRETPRSRHVPPYRHGLVSLHEYATETPQNKR